MRTRIVSASAAWLLAFAICASCGGGGGGGEGAGEETASRGVVSVALTWRGDDAAAGYVVHWGTASRMYSHDVDVRKPVADAEGAVTVVIALDGAVGSTYYFAITSYDASMTPSDYSNELSITATDD